MNAGQRLWSLRTFFCLWLLTMAFDARGQFKCATNNGAITITGTYISYSPGVVLTVPGFTNGYPVTSIGAAAFEYNNLTGLIIPDSVTNIGGHACYQCANLKNVVFGHGLKAIGTYAFGGCIALTNIVWQPGLSVISDHAFQGCTNLMSVNLPEGVTDIGQEAFEHTGLGRINIPDSVTNIDMVAFDLCGGLTNIVVGSGVATIGSDAFGNRGVNMNIFFKGSPPPGGFLPVPGNTLYYLPGATGWGTNYRGYATTLWNPQAQTMDGLFGVQGNHFGFTITGSTNIPIVVEVCSNLAAGNWAALQSFTLTNGSDYFSDSYGRTNGERFYRFRSP